jgi:hypothetical protein
VAAYRAVTAHSAGKQHAAMTRLLCSDCRVRAARILYGDHARMPRPHAV